MKVKQTSKEAKMLGKKSKARSKSTNTIKYYRRKDELQRIIDSIVKKHAEKNYPSEEWVKDHVRVEVKLPYDIYEGKVKKQNTIPAIIRTVLVKNTIDYGSFRAEPIVVDEHPITLSLSEVKKIKVAISKFNRTK